MSVSLHEHRLGGPRWIPLADLAEGNARARRPFERARF